MSRVLSGIKSSGEPTLGNYIGAIKRWVKMQPEETNDPTGHLFFVPNLHALTVRPEPNTLRNDTLSNVAWLIAAGLDPAKVTIFVQSQIPAHAEFAWILNNYVTMGELSRMTQFKDKSAKSGAEGALVGLYTYPALMAADILLYDVTEVPVGDDQRQHVELARTIAERINNLYGDLLVVPRATVADEGARVMSLQNPMSKMSKTEEDPSGTIMLTDSAEEIAQKFKRAVTDSGSEIKGGKGKPALENLLTIYGVVTGLSRGEIEQRFVGKGYGDFKASLSEVVIQHLAPIQKRHSQLMLDQAQLKVILDTGRDRAAAIAEEKIAQIKHTLGIL